MILIYINRFVVLGTYYRCLTYRFTPLRCAGPSQLMLIRHHEFFFPKNLSMMRAMKPSPVTLHAVPKLSMAM